MSGLVIRDPPSADWRKKHRNRHLFESQSVRIIKDRSREDRRKPEHVLRRAREQVRAGKAKTLSSLVSDTVAEKVARDELSEILDAMDAAHGRPDKAAKAWAKRLFKR